MRRMEKSISSATAEILQIYADGLRNIYGKHLVSITLFGSYARGDFTEASDIDVFVVVDLPENSLESRFDALCDFTAHMNLEHDVELAPVVVSKRRYQYWGGVHPLFHEVQKDGVVLYEAA